MKRILRTFFVLLIILISSVGINAQEEKKESPFSVGADFVSRYVWRGTDFGNAPAIQPTIEFDKGNFAIGAWGSHSLSSNTGGLEADLYAGYSFNFGLSLGLTDYYFPGEALTVDSLGIITPSRSGSYFDYADAHTFEVNLGYEIKDFSISANYMTSDNIYFELGYSIAGIDIFLGAGNESYTSNGDFGICNVGFSTSKEIPLTDKFALPVTGSIILNPDTEQVHFVVGLSF